MGGNLLCQAVDCHIFRQRRKHSNYSTLLINPRILYLKVAVIAPHMQTFQSSEKS